MVCPKCGKITQRSYNGLCQGCYKYFKSGGKVYPLPEAGTVEHDENGKVICHICGRSYNRLGSHIRESHGMTIEEYKAEFGLCRRTKTTEKNYSHIMREKAYQNNMDQQLLQAGKSTRIKKGETDKRKNKGELIMDKVFLYRIKDSDDRDCCAYIDNNPVRFECGHYFGRPILHGSCYCNSDWKNYDEIETVLTESEYKALIQFDAAIGSLGYGIDKDSERYQEGMKLCKGIQAVYDKLNGEEAKAFYQKIIAEEKQIVMDEYDMTEEQVKAAFNNYPLSHNYQDRSIIGSVFDDASDLGYEEAFSLGYIKKDDYILEEYFDYEKFGNDLLEQEEYYELDDGRCIYYMM